MEQKIAWAVAFMLVVSSIVSAVRVTTNPRLIPDLMPKAFIADFLLCAVLSLLINCLYATAVSVFGRKLGGKATVKRVFLIGAYSVGPLVFVGTNFLAPIGIIWSVVLAVIGLRVAHGVSTRIAVALEAGFVTSIALIFALTIYSVTKLPAIKFEADRLLNKPAPAAIFEKLDGSGKIELTHLRGQVVMIDFWATWCGPCRASMPTLSEIAKEFEPQGVVALAVANDEREPAKRYLDSMKFNFIGVLGSTDLNNKFLVNAIPETVIIDRNGIVQAVHVGVGRDHREQVRADILKCLKPSAVPIEQSH